MIEKIDNVYLMNTIQTAYDSESLTQSELVGRVTNKVNECVDLVNGVQQIALEATSIVDEM
jgi:hypothetical protein